VDLTEWPRERNFIKMFNAMRSLTTEAILKWKHLLLQPIPSGAHLSRTTTRLTCPCTCVLPMSCI
jgi:hypothetical protein